MVSHRKHLLIQEVYTLTQEVCKWTYIIKLMFTYSLVHAVGVGFLEARGRNTLEVEGTGLDNGET